MKTPREKYNEFCKVASALGTIYSDIQREINLKRAGKKAGSHICALALLCYTEYAGNIQKEILGKKLKPKKRFELFFQSFGSQYADFLKKNPKAYDIFRCGLAHEYYFKEPCVIYMLKRNQNEIGIGKDSNGMYYFVVEKYLEDFKKAFNKLRDDVANKTIYSS